MDPATSTRMGFAVVTVAVLLVISVKNTTKLITKATASQIGTDSSP